MVEFDLCRISQLMQLEPNAFIERVPDRGKAESPAHCAARSDLHALYLRGFIH